MKRLTRRQTEVLQLILASFEGRGYAPTCRELMDEMGIRSTNGISDHLRILVRKGYLRRDYAEARGIVPLLTPEGDPVRVAVITEDEMALVQQHRDGKTDLAVPPAPPTTFATPENAWQWAVNQGAYATLDEARDAYEDVKALVKPTNASQMAQAWIAAVEARG